MGNMSVIGIVVNSIIIIGGLIVWVNLYNCSKKYRKLYSEAKSLYRETKSSAHIMQGNGNMGYNTFTELDVEAMDEVISSFNAENSKYLTHIQFISIFPLLGLLGTVAGLIPGLAGIREQNFEILYGAMSTALYSTLLGLIVAIILKAYVAISPSKTINDIESKLEENDRAYELHYKQQTINKD